ncbi:MAG: class I SAM-dependent methyltransferase [Bacteroidota bacterium]
MSATDVFGTALKEYLIGNEDAHLTLHNSYGDPEEMPVAVFFREEEDLTDLEKLALASCKGKTLDVGAGTGAISLIAQNYLDITALEVSADACEVAALLGVQQIVQGDIWSYNDMRYDTLLLLMNGIGIVEKFNRLLPFLSHLRRLLKDGGQILLDSSDLTYLHPDFSSNPKLGEVSYQYEYDGLKGNWFNWLYVDPNTLRETASKVGFTTDILLVNEEDQFLARLTELD